VVLAAVAVPPVAAAAAPPSIVVENGVTQPVFRYAAIRERVRPQRFSKLLLPIVGGKKAALAAGL
jgi:hypothetical protein